MRVLLVEDSDDDILLTTEALESGKLQVDLHVVKTGTDAMAYLRCEGRYADALRPELILLDLNLPGIDGREVLRRVKDDPHLHTIPVVVMTTSRAEEDVEMAYGLHANCYVTKPVGLDAFIEIVHSIEDFWLTVVRLPNGERP
ncbi:MAG: response regulator [Actinomycetes bacterium]